jgi:L-fuculose-phosphate aldolase
MILKELKYLQKEIACFMRRLYDRGLTTASGGNISIRLKDEILITPSALDKGCIKAKHIGMISIKGENLTPGLKPSIESGMHLAIYQMRPDVNAIVHAHPPTATTFTAINKEINCTLIAEARAVLGQPEMAPYALMGTEELAATAAAAAVKKDPATAMKPNVILLENHGVICFGKDLLTAFDRMEVLECAAKMTLISTLMGGAKPLSAGQLVEIDALFKNY